jgi:hypothetical protein
LSLRMMSRADFSSEPSDCAVVGVVFIIINLLPIFYIVGSIIFRNCARILLKLGDLLSAR